MEMLLYNILEPIQFKVNMKSMPYLSLDVIDLYCPLGLKKITVRGTIAASNIYFSSNDVQDSLFISLPSQTPFIWINTPSGRDKYLSYETLKRVLSEPYHPLESIERIQIYERWIDSILSNPAKSLASNTDTESFTSDSDFGSIADSFDSHFQHKMDQLAHQLELAKKDNEIYIHRLQAKEKEIELLKLRVSLLSTNASWV